MYSDRHLFVYVGCLAFAVCIPPATAQTWDMLPDPSDVIHGMPKRENYDWGACDINYYSAVGEEVQKIHERLGRCNEFSKGKYRDYTLWTRGQHDTDDGRDYGGGALGDYENVPSYFAYYGIEWWDGKMSPGYVEEARYGSTLAPGLTPTFPVLARSTSEKADAQLSDARAADPARQAAAPTSGALGACGLPVANEAQRQEQAIYAKYGTCDTIEASRAGGW